MQMIDLAASRDPEIVRVVEAMRTMRKVTAAGSCKERGDAVVTLCRRVEEFLASCRPAEPARALKG